MSLYIIIINLQRPSYLRIHNYSKHQTRYIIQEDGADAKHNTDLTTCFTPSKSASGADNSYLNHSVTYYQA